MIDIENLVFDTFYTAFHTLHADANVTAGYDEQNALFPSVIVRQTNNQPYREMNTDDCAENYSRITFEIEVISSKADTGRSECKLLINDADTIMQSMKFRRIHLNRPINVDRTLWRQYARYEVIVGKPTTTVTGEGDNTETTITYHMYRR